MGASDNRIDAVLKEIYSRLLDLRSLLAREVTPESLSAVRRDVDSLIEQFEREVLRTASDNSAIRLFESLRSADEVLDQINRQWYEIRSVVGFAAARELLRDADIYAGWQAKFASLIEQAWQHRRIVEGDRASSSSYAETNWLPPLSHVDRSRGKFASLRSDADILPVILDLRYVLNLPLARIAELLNLSIGGVQADIVEFEDGLLASVAREAIDRQVPEGWQIMSSPFGPAGMLHLTLRRVSAPSGPRLMIALDILPVWENRDIAAGRPRSSLRAAYARQSSRSARIWVVVFSGGPRIVFVPDSVVRGDGEPGVVTPNQVIAAAESGGLPVLADAIKVALTEDARMPGRGLE
jgi:hypothetical protein